jgi:hypothetical protein
MATIADNFKPKPLNLFSDFTNNLDLHPLSNDIATVKAEQAIKQSIKNLILTNVGERFFNPLLGSNVYRSLFEQLDGFTMNNIKMYVQDTIKAFEPRANLQAVTVVENGDGRNSVTVTIQFTIINTGQDSILNLILRRVR